MESQVSRIKNGASHNPECCEEGNRVVKQKINKNSCIHSYCAGFEDEIKIQAWKGFTNTQELGCLPGVGADMEIQSIEDLHLIHGNWQQTW